MKLRYLVLGIALIGASTAVSLAADAAAPTTDAAATTSSTPAAPATGTQTPAAPTAPAAAETPAPAQPDPNEKICKKDETTGSRLGKICKTRKEWDEEAKGGGADF